MTVVEKLLRRLSAWLNDEFYEGPKRVEDGLGECVQDFMDARPFATREEWRLFAIRLSRGAYDAGYLRGHEDAVRLDLDLGPSPEEIADALDPEWRHPSRGIPIDDLTAVVPEEREEVKITEANIRAANVVAAAKRNSRT